VDAKKDWKVVFNQEIEKAEAARASGNEGKARVCARRAAGAAAREYFMRRNSPSAQESAYYNLQRLRDQADLPTSIRQIADYFLERITEDHELPSEADLIHEACLLAGELLGEE
jgi:hypothetical protein